MVDTSPVKKGDEQHPLLKVSAVRNNDAGHKDQQSAGFSCGWKVTCMKSTWIDRWPELVSACWMTLILLGVTFLVCCGLGLGTYRLQTTPLVRNIEDQTQQNVFFHSIVKYNYVPLSYYNEYLTALAKEFPGLKFNVFFLLDDSLQYTLRKTRHGKFIKKIFQRPINEDIVVLSDRNRQELNSIQKKVRNLNITVMYLSKFMSIMPIKDTWKSMPLSTLPFYARICSVWMYGGIGMDMFTFSHPYGMEGLSRRANTILRQHNEGKAGYYSNVLHNIDQDEETEIFRNLFGFVNQLFRETQSMFVPLSSLDNDENYDKSVIRTHRNKRETIEDKKIDIDKEQNKSTIDTNTTASFSKKISYPSTEIKNGTILNMSKTNIPAETNTTSVTNIVVTKNDTDISLEIENQTHQPLSFFMFYDFSFSDPFGVSNVASGSDVPSTSQNTRNSNNVDEDAINNILLDSDGLFVAAASPHNSFLEKLISSDCQRSNPRCIIKNSFIAQCTGPNKQSYCKNVKVI